MHEPSLAVGIVEAATEELQRRGLQATAVHLRLGALSGVVKGALLFSYEMACQATPLQGSKRLSAKTGQGLDHFGATGREPGSRSSAERTGAKSKPNQPADSAFSRGWA